MFRHFLRAVGQLTDPAIAGVLLTSILATLALFVLLTAGVWFTLSQTALFTIGWLETAVDFLGGFAVLVIVWLLFPAMVVAVSSIMLERVVRAVERRHYPHLGPARKQSLPEGLWNSLKFLAVVILLNLIVLPLYLIPVINLMVFYTLNGYLLGREYYELVSLRRLSPDRMRYLRSEEGLRLFSAGVIIAFLSVVPFVNLLVPVIATAFMVHVFENMRQGLPPGTTA